MLGHILLLCDAVERPFLTDTLHSHAPKLDVRHVADPAALSGVDPKILPESRLVTFNSGASIPAAVLAALGHEAYNVHGGSPAYPGWMPASFASYDGATEFGATAHAITGRDEGGVIIAVDTFPVTPGTMPADLARRTYMAMLGLFRRIAPALAQRPGALPTLPLVWSQRRTTRALFAELCDIPVTIDKEEMLRRIRSLGAGDGYSQPTITLHGVPFSYSPPDESQT